MNKIDLDKELNNLTFEDINCDHNLFDSTILKIKQKRKRKNTLLIIGLILTSLLYLLILFSVINYQHLEKHYIYLLITSITACYTSIIIFIMFLLNIYPYLKQTFKLNY